MTISEEGHVSVVADPQGAVFGIHAKKTLIKPGNQHTEDNETN